MKSNPPNKTLTTAVKDRSFFMGIFKRKTVKPAPNNDEGINVVAIGYWGLLILAAGMAVFAVVDWLHSNSRIDLPFWWEVISGFLGLAGAFKISAGAFLTGKHTQALFHPYNEGHPSDHKEMMVVMRGIRDLMVGASDAAIRGTIWLLIAFMMVLCKPAIDEFAHAPIPSKTESKATLKLQTTQPPPKGALLLQGSASPLAGPAPVPNCQSASCPH